MGRTRTRIVLPALLAVALCAPTSAVAQEETEVAPFFEQVPAIMYETYRGVTPAFGDYFSMLVDRYEAAGGGYGWAVYREGPKIGYRITVLPNGLESMMEIQQARQTSFADFGEDEMALWNAAWETRQVQVYGAAPGLSVVPDGFTLEDMRALPYHRATVYRLDWDKAPAFRDALRQRSALEREAGIGNYVMTVWNGGIGTEAQTVMIVWASESPQAYFGPDLDARRAGREGISEEGGRLTRIMNESARSAELHELRRIARLSYTP